MRFSNLAPLTIGVLLLASLSGCAPSGTPESPEPTATFVAPYATDEEALAAAEEAYAEYLRVSDEVVIDGGADEERLESVATGRFLEKSMEEMREFSANGYRASGTTSFSDIALQRYSSSVGPTDLISVYLCSDVSGTDVLNANGESLVADSREDLATLQVTFSLDEPEKKLLVSDQLLWKSGEC